MIECLMGGERMHIDARGQIAPLPLVGLKRALGRAATGQEVELVSDDPALGIDIERFLKEAGDELLYADPQGRLTRYLIRKSESR